MEVLTPRYSKEEFARRGDEIYERKVRPHLTQSDEGKFIVIDIEIFLIDFKSGMPWFWTVGTRWAARS